MVETRTQSRKRERKPSGELSLPFDRPGQVAKPVGSSDGAQTKASHVAETEPESEVTTQAPPVISVSELTRQIRTNLESSFPRVFVRGEISNFKAHASGHFYFTLKDDGAQT